MRDIEDLSAGEVASMLGITPNAMKVRGHRIRQALGTLLRRRFKSAGIHLEVSTRASRNPLQSSSTSGNRREHQNTSRSAGRGTLRPIGFTCSPTHQTAPTPRRCNGRAALPFFGAGASRSPRGLVSTRAESLRMRRSSGPRPSRAQCGCGCTCPPGTRFNVPTSSPLASSSRFIHAEWS